MVRVVQTPAEGGPAAGKHTASFDIRNSSFVIPSGVYFIRLSSTNCRKTRKVVLTWQVDFTRELLGAAREVGGGLRR